MTDAGWKRLAWRHVFRSPWFNVRQDDVLLPGGEQIQYNVVEHGGWVLVVPLFEDGSILMERVYRWTLQDWLLECPSGGRDGEPPEVAGRRELEEETGHRAENLRHLGRFAASDGYSDELYDVFLATGLTEDGQMAREPTELMKLERMPLAVLEEMALHAEIPDGPSALAILLVAAFVRRMDAKESR